MLLYHETNKKSTTIKGVATGSFPVQIAFSP